MKRRYLLIFKAQVQAMLALSASGRQDEWKNGDPEWVTRGKDGRFGRTGGAIKESASTASDTVQMLIQDKDFRERAGLAAGAFGAKLVKKMAGLSPQVVAKLDGIIAESESKLGLDSIKIAEVPKDADLAARMEYSIARYKVLQEAIAKTPETKDKDNGLAKAIKASIPVIANIAVAVGPAVAVSLVEKGDLESLLVSTSASVAASLATEKALEAAQIKDPKVKAAIRLAVSTAAAYAAIGVDNKFVNKISENDLSPTANIGRELGLKARDARRLGGALRDRGIDAEQVFKVIQRNKKLHLSESDVPVTDRLKEVSSLVRKPGGKLGVEWRQGIVKSEIKYGEAINKLLDADPSDIVAYNKTVEDWVKSSRHILSKKDVDKLKESPKDIASLELNFSGYGAAWHTKREPWNYSPKSKEAYKSFSLLQAGKERQDANVSIYSEESGAAEAIVSKILDPRKQLRLNEAQEQCRIFSSIVQGSVRDNFLTSTSRGGGDYETVGAYVINRDRYNLIEVGNEFGDGNNIREYMFHEMGHVVEHVKKITPACWDYIDDRKESGKTLPYAYSYFKYDRGKYPNSEIVSTATQMLSDAKDLHRIASIDRDHLMFGLWALDK